MTQDTQAGAGAHPAPAIQPEAMRIAMHLRQRAQLARPGNLDTLSASGANELERQHAELAAAQSEAKHWRTNHDNVVARLRIFTQRPDIPKELADRLPWYRELVRLQEVEAQAAAKCLDQGAEPAPVTYMATDNACKWAWDQIRKDVGTEGWTTSESCNFYGFFMWGWIYRGQYETQRPAAPPAPAAVAVPDEGAMFEAWVRTHEDAHGAFDDWSARAGWEARAALAAAPAQAQDDRAAFKAYLQECDDCEIVPDVAGAFHAAWQKRAAPAQAVASSITIDFKQAAELLEMFGGEPAEITLMMGDGHSGNGLYASYTDMPEEGAGFLGKPDNEALPAAPAQEHATQLAGQGQFQQRVQPWLLECFGAEIAGDKAERNHRFLEEALELVQACGCTASEAHQLVDYVFGRPVGEPAQEVGGVMATLAALCLASGLDMHQAGEVELARIWGKVEQIRAKQAAKPRHSPLPAAPAQAQEDARDHTAVLCDLLNRRPAMNVGLDAEYAAWSDECYRIMGALSQAAANDDGAQEGAQDAVRALIATHAEMLEDNAYAYFELAYTRQTGWMAWITDKPLYGAPVINPDRKVLAQGQGDTPDEACADAARAAQGDAA